MLEKPRNRERSGLVVRWRTDDAQAVAATPTMSQPKARRLDMCLDRCRVSKKCDVTTMVSSRRSRERHAPPSLFVTQAPGTNAMRMLGYRCNARCEISASSPTEL